MKNKHPYQNRKWWRERLPWFLIDLGIAQKGENCEIVNANHHWYNMNGKQSGCYYCKVIKDDTTVQTQKEPYLS